MKLTWHKAEDKDLSLLSEWNHRLIRDEGHRNEMNMSQLEERMRSWLLGDYEAIIFTEDQPVAYALFKQNSDRIHLRQFFVILEKRRMGIGRSAIQILKREIWSSDLRLTVDVLCQNQSGIEFWRSVGYKDYCMTLEIESLTKI